MSYEYQAPGYAPGPKPDNYLVWAILSTVLCCLPAGIVSIVYASQVDGKWHSGDFAGAQQSAKNARTWAIVSVCVSLVLIVAYIIFFVAVIARSNP